MENMWQRHGTTPPVWAPDTDMAITTAFTFFVDSFNLAMQQASQEMSIQTAFSQVMPSLM